MWSFLPRRARDVVRRGTVLALLLAAGCVAESGETESASQDELTANSDAAKVLVYSNNVENMIFDWKDLTYYMKTQPKRPDLFFVQQMTDAARLGEMTKAMSTILGATYAGRVAEDNPTNHRQGSEVSPSPTVTTGIIYRTARFAFVSQETWFPFGAPDATTGATDCTVRHESSAYETIKLTLHDKVAGHDITVVSLRHPTGSPCPAENVADIDAHLPSSRSLTIVGGDFNDDPTATNAKGDCWYRSMVGKLNACAGAPNLHFSDPLYDDCAGDMTCVQKRQGIDHIFGRNHDTTPARTDTYGRVSFAEGNDANSAVKGSDGLSNTTAVNGFDDVTSDYSQHQARTAYFYYAK
jgi:hypothetical protein